MNCEHHTCRCLAAVRLLRLADMDEELGHEVRAHQWLRAALAVHKRSVPCRMVDIHRPAVPVVISTNVKDWLRQLGKALN